MKNPPVLCLIGANSFLLSFGRFFNTHNNTQHEGSRNTHEQGRYET
jgi:hypothetical protein